MDAPQPARGRPASPFRLEQMNLTLRATTVERLRTYHAEVCAEMDDPPNNLSAFADFVLNMGLLAMAQADEQLAIEDFKARKNHQPMSVERTA